jgi:hypothetical protein
MSELPRFCRETQECLPSLLADELTGWSGRVVRRHVARCADCTAELERQREVSHALARLKMETPEPPAELLQTLLVAAKKPGWRGRAAVPARGAVSGAKPHLSIAMLTVGAVATTGLGWAAWRGSRKVSNALRHH